jgi:hypothetical protein
MLALTGHHVIGAPADDELRGVVLRVHCADRDDRGGEAGERFQQLPHCGDLVRFRVHGNLPEDCADAVGQCRDQVRGLPGLALRTADRLAADRDHQPAADPHGPLSTARRREPCRACLD